MAGFPGRINCFDCSAWHWKNCPKALHDIMSGEDGKPIVQVEVVCSLDLWIWSFWFGLTGAMNDLNIFEISDHFSKVLSGQFRPVTPSYKIAGNYSAGTIIWPMRSIQLGDVLSNHSPNPVKTSPRTFMLFMSLWASVSCVYLVSSIRG